MLIDELLVFDRMFSLGVRGSGSGSDPAPLGGRLPGVQGPAVGPRRHFLYCSLGLETVRPKKTREL